MNKYFFFSNEKIQHQIFFQYLQNIFMVLKFSTDDLKKIKIDLILFPAWKLKFQFFFRICKSPKLKKILLLNLYSQTSFFIKNVENISSDFSILKGLTIITRLTVIQEMVSSTTRP